MPYIFLLLFSILFTACTMDGTTTPTPSKKTETVVRTTTPSVPVNTSSVPVITSTTTSPLVTESIDLEPIVENSSVSTTDISEDELNTPSLPVTEQITDNDFTIIPEDSITGKYTLKQGSFSHGAIFQNITEGYLVIEELFPQNYGYYAVTIIDKMSPETQSGIFYKKDGKFVQKVIYDDENSDGSTAKSHISIIDNLDIKQNGDLLQINIDSTKKQRTTWERDDGVQQSSPKLLDALQNARQEYFDFYKKKCLNKSVECSEESYTPVND